MAGDARAAVNCSGGLEEGSAYQHARIIPGFGASGDGIKERTCTVLSQTRPRFYWEEWLKGKRRGAGHRGSLRGLPGWPSRPVAGGPPGFPGPPPAQRFHGPLRRVPTNTESGTEYPPAPPSSRGQRARTGVWGRAGKVRPSPAAGTRGLLKRKGGRAAKGALLHRLEALPVLSRAPSLSFDWGISPFLLREQAVTPCLRNWCRSQLDLVEKKAPHF